MLSVSQRLASRPQKQHFRKKIPNFYSSYYGASFMKRWPVLPYKRMSPSLFHYPAVSKVTGRKINWMYDTPKSGFEGAVVYGPNTIELKGLPMLKTPEYLQERLRRYFSKFGTVTMCRALNHPLDPYQCDGTAYITFRDLDSAEKAMGSIVRFSREMGNKVLSLRGLWNDVTTDGPRLLQGKKDRLNELVAHVRDVYESSLVDNVPVEFDSEIILSQFTSADEFHACIKTMFVRSSDGAFLPRRLIDFSKNIDRFEKLMDKKLEESLTVHWRAHAPIKELPAYTERRNRLWDKKDKLPFDLQILSRDFREHKIHNEKFLVARRARRERIRSKREHAKVASLEV
jgi:hypothetical protein